MTEISGDARRTSLANERTQLAWWRTGLTSLAVALAVGRLVPEIGHGHTQWPYTLVGVAFAIYGIVLIAYGSVRARSVDRHAARGEAAPTPFATLSALGFAGIVLGLLIVLLVIFD